MTAVVAAPTSSTLPRWRAELEVLEAVCPWPGPRPLREEDEALLCGRADDCAAFRREVDAHHLMLLTGVSGVGKTSLLRAGLVPELRTSGYRVAVCRDWTGSAQETDSAAFLARIVSRELGRMGIKDLATDSSMFWQLDQRFGGRAVLVLDQFEELIRDARDFKDDLFEVLADINHRTSIRVVISFRSEYLHELRPLESKARPFTISHYFLEEVDPTNAQELVEAGNTANRLAIDPDAVEEVVAGWTDAVQQRSTTAGGRERVGLLHLQSLLYALEDAAGHDTVTTTTMKTFRRNHRLRRADPAGLFWGALGAAAEVKLNRCRKASSEVGLDPYLVDGTTHLLARSVRHLSSAGYKLVRDSWELANTTLGAELGDLRAGIELCEAHEGANRDGPISDEQLQALFETLVGLIQYREDTSDEPSTGVPSDEEAQVAAPSVDLLSTDRLAIAERADDACKDPVTLKWVSRLHPDGPPLSLDQIPVTCGPMLGMAPAAVLIEEMRRFAFALEWLQASSLVRLNTPVTGGAMVALIHDGFGTVLDPWSKEAVRQPSGALHALTAPKAAEFDWRSDPEIDTEHLEDPEVLEVLDDLDLGAAFLPQLDGAADGRGRSPRPIHQLAVPPARLLVNLRWRGALVHAGFRQVGFVNCDFRGAIFKRCVFDGATFVNCLLDGVIFSDCVIMGNPTGAARTWKPEAQTYVLRAADGGPSVIARYRGLDINAPAMLSQLPGLPARPSGDSPTSIEIGVEPGGLVVYGGRVSSLVMRRCSFKADGKVRLRDTAGSGLDVVEIGAGGTYEIVGSRLRHVTFTSSSTEAAPGKDDRLLINVVGSIVAQVWVGDDLRGRLDIDNSRLVQVWNGSANVESRARNSRFHGLVNVAVDATCTGFVTDEKPIPLAAVNRGRAITRMSRGMDYQEKPSVPSRKSMVT